MAFKELIKARKCIGVSADHVTVSADATAVFLHADSRGCAQ